MFAAFCPYQEARVLLSPSNILEMERRDGTMWVRYRCWCGHEGWHSFGRTARAATRTHVTSVPTTAPMPTSALAPRQVPAPC